ncbi:MAG: ATP-dependent helicase [Anaerolineae bacterium]|nr:ATP-dependent helicase [Anaerolineae bacterium]MDW8100473.1 ATP-dependent helicase [Anaerolineae bacterium]
MFKPRHQQQEVLAYTGGWMGVAAVPGSGKTHTLSYLAAQLIASGVLEEDQEVLIVTLVNSAVNSFAQRVASFLQQRGLLPYFGYRVRTLHGLAHDIIRERPALVGLADDFQIVDEHLAGQILQDAVDTWVRDHPHIADSFLSPDLEGRSRERVRNKDWPELMREVASSFIRQAKDLQLTPAEVRARLDAFPMPLPLAEMGWAIYAEYQRALNHRGAVDFDDLIRLALQALETDRAYLERLRRRWPFILEDEAQDSSRLQEKILRLLASPHGNWVRVGDPNQAIYETFTTANPRFLRDFLREPGVKACQLPNSGRSTRSIIHLANRLISWTQETHPLEAVRDALLPPLIEPAPPDDPQPNPPDSAGRIWISRRGYNRDEEIQHVVKSLARWLPQHPEATVAVLVPRNERGFEVVDELKRHNLKYVELLRSSQATREAAGILGDIVSYLADPISPSGLEKAYRAWQLCGGNDQTSSDAERIARWLSRCSRVEDYLWPRAGHDWLDDLKLCTEETTIRQRLIEFRERVRRWQKATALPVDQLILTLAQDLFHEPSDLAIAYRLASAMRQASEANPAWRLPELAQELKMIAENDRRFLGLSEDDIGFDPERHKGKVVVATIHKAKGLEFDRVYLLSVNSYDFPSGLPGDQFIAEKWFVRDGLNLEAEALAQLRALEQANERGEEMYVEGKATQEARLGYVAERLRLLYVGITRARKELLITWNTGRPERPQSAAVPLTALWKWWEGRTDGIA